MGNAHLILNDLIRSVRECGTRLRHTLLSCPLLPLGTHTGNARSRKYFLEECSGKQNTSSIRTGAYQYVTDTNIQPEPI